MTVVRVHMRDARGQPLFALDGSPLTWDISTEPRPRDNSVIRYARIARKCTIPRAQLEEIAAHVHDWRGWHDEGGVPCTSAMVLAVLVRAPWFRRQVLDTLEQLRNPEAVS